jgi:FkbM family methyltransferase
MNLIKTTLKEILFLFSNFKTISKYILIDLIKFVKKIKIYKKYLNIQNLESSQSEFDSTITELDNSIFLFNKKEFNENSNTSFTKRTEFNYFKNSGDSINKFLIKNIVKEGDTVIDIGAHIGLYSVFLSKLVGPSGKVICFEPHEQVVKRLYNNLLLNGLNNYEIHNYGVGDKDEEVDFNMILEEKMFEGTVNSSFLENEKIDSNYFDGKFIKKKTKVKKLDSLFNEQKIKFIKIDTEGYEFNILVGMKNLIKKFKPIIIAEYQTKRLKHLKIDINLFKKITEENYNAFKILIDVTTNSVALKEFFFDDEKEYSGDLLFLPKISNIKK